MRYRDVVVIGAGAAGMMCAIEAAKRGRSVAVLDHARKAGDKIRISGGGRCNFTNINCTPKNFISNNPHFCISALKRYTQHDFIKLIQQYKIDYHEKTLGQLFCDGSANQIIDLLLTEMRKYQAELYLQCSISSIKKLETGYLVEHSDGAFECQSLVIATGGKSIPKMGATGFGYDVAKQFGLGLVETRPGLVPLTFEPNMLERIKPLAGIAVDAVVSCNKTKFKEALLFTHRGLSGPSILQISSYWREGDEITITMQPDQDIFAKLRDQKTLNGKQTVTTALSYILPKKLAQFVTADIEQSKHIADLSDKILRQVADLAQQWRIKPSGSEGYRTAEVTIGGVDTQQLDSRTMEARNVSGLYFIGEVVDVTGWLGGYNFHWAWASGWAAGQAV